VRALDRNLPLGEIKTMDERVGDARWRMCVGAWLLSAFAKLALLLTAIECYAARLAAMDDGIVEPWPRCARRDSTPTRWSSSSATTGDRRSSEESTDRT
jgi:hypothetical protein